MAEKLLRGQSDISQQVPMPTDRVDDTSVVNTSTAETVVWYYISTGAWSAAVGQAAGTICTAKLTYTGVLNSMKSSLGSYNDSSLSFGAATRASQQISLPDAVMSQLVFMTPTEQKALVSQYLITLGDFAIDHRRGQIWLNSKATVANDSATYNYATSQSSTSTTLVTSDIEIGAVELKDADTDVRANIKAANTSRSTATIVVATQNIDETGKVTGGVPTVLTGGSKTVTTSGTALALGTTLATKSIYIRAKAANTGNIFVGDSAVDAVTSQQIILTANDSVTLDIADRATVFVDCSVNGEGVDYLCMS